VTKVNKRDAAAADRLLTEDHVDHDPLSSPTATRPTALSGAPSSPRFR
jgi:hypothetical protein